MMFGTCPIHGCCIVVEDAENAGCQKRLAWQYREQPDRHHRDIDLRSSSLMIRKLFPIAAKSRS
jgi:hypothetical protein